jgi:hypothetical protein
MKRKIIAIITLSFLSACGSQEHACLSNCADSMLKSTNKCDISHERYSEKGSACTTAAMQDHTQCNALCYGNL